MNRTYDSVSERNRTGRRKICTSVKGTEKIVKDQNYSIGIIRSEQNVFMFIHVLNGQIFAWQKYFRIMHGCIRVFDWQK